MAPSADKRLGQNVEKYLLSDLEEILSVGHPYFSSIRNQRILITGGTGFIGRWIVLALSHANQVLRLGNRLVVLSRNPRGWKEDIFLSNLPDIEIFQGDLLHSLSSLAGEIDAIVHLASPLPGKPGTKNNLKMLDAIVTGTRNVLELARIKRTRAILFTSSGAVYGAQPSEMEQIGEDYLGAPDPCDLRSTYGTGKRLSEHLLIHYMNEFGIEAKIARCFAVLGPFLPLDAHYAVGNFIRDGLEKRTIGILGDGSPFRSYLYSADLVVWLMAILTNGKAGRPYNVGSDQMLTIEELARLIARRLEVGVSIRETRDSLAPRQRYVPSNRRAREELSLGQTVVLKDAIERTLRWHQSAI